MAREPDEIMPPSAQHAVPANYVRTTDGEVTAMRVAVPRNLVKVRQQIKEWAAAFPDRCMYSIPFKNRRTGEITNVEGPTVKLAHMMARAFGNCRIDVMLDPMNTTQQEYVFMGRFVDLETGFTVMRPFRQRRNQDTGMKDDGRREDMVFQIGVSKAQRNVVVNALDLLVEEALDEVRAGLLARVEKQPDEARARLKKGFAELGVELKRVERVVGKAIDKWTVSDLVAVIKQAQAVADGFTTADDIWPTDEAVAQAEREASASRAQPIDQGNPPAQQGAEQKPATAKEKAKEKGKEKPAPEAKAGGETAPAPSAEAAAATQTTKEKPADPPAETKAGDKPADKAKGGEAFGDGLTFS